jgi:biopolymer transport protein ExbB
MFFLRKIGNFRSVTIFTLKFATHVEENSFKRLEKKLFARPPKNEFDASLLSNAFLKTGSGKVDFRKSWKMGFCGGRKCILIYFFKPKFISMTAAKTTVANAQQPKSGGLFAMIAIPILFILAVLIYKFVFGAANNFIDGNIDKDPVSTNESTMRHYLGVVYKGGFVVPLLLTTFFTVIVITIERFITLAKAGGNGNVDGFVRAVKGFLDRGDIAGAVTACDKQRGSVANVVRAGLHKYSEMTSVSGMERDQKVLAIQKEVEEATTLEMPALEQNLNILATIASIATLLGLFGTVIGMIRSFGALANAGAPDSSALATGISEALINTALGIGTSFLAIVFYNIFTSKIDGMTYRIDESGYSLAQSFASKH